MIFHTMNKMNELYGTILHFLYVIYMDRITDLQLWTRLFACDYINVSRQPS
jgi:hypothetical protein